MSHDTERYLLATRRLADAARSMSPHTARLRGELARAQVAWVDAGCPDCPPEPPPKVDVFICRRRS